MKKKIVLFNIISDRYLIAIARSFIIKIPGAWRAYYFFWRIRSFIEAKLTYKSNVPILKFTEDSEPSLENPTSQLCTSRQMKTALYRSWCKKLYSPARFSRKQWEFVYILQSLYLSDVLKKGNCGIGFGCGREPLAGVFASYGVNVLATDLNHEEAKMGGWVNTMQHASSLDDLYTASKYIVSRKSFYELVSFKELDMNHIPRSLYNKYDFLWSACALEHLGSLEHGLRFIKNSARCLKPGGVAVHTTEFNLSSNDRTVESTDCSVYRARDIKKLIIELEKDGFEVAPLNLNTGQGSIDQYVDLPPYRFSPHLKLEIGQYVVTSIGMIIRRKVSSNVV